MKKSKLNKGTFQKTATMMSRQCISAKQNKNVDLSEILRIRYGCQWITVIE